MQGNHHEGDGGPGPRQAPAVLAAWVRQLLAQVRATQLRRIEELRAQLEAEIFAWDNTPLAQALHALYAGGRELHFAQLRTGWLRRALGRHRAAFARFTAAADRAGACAAAVSRQAGAVADASRPHNAEARRVLVELDLECRELGSEMEQGVTWLQEMCEGINEQRSRGGAGRDLPALAEAAQSYTQEFKRLQSVSCMLRDIGVRGQDVLARRAALLDQVRADMEAFEEHWNTRVGDVAAAARAGHAAMPGIGKAAEAHDAAMRRVEAALDACGALQGEEHLLAQQLDALRQSLPGRR